MKSPRLWHRFWYSTGYKLELQGLPVSIWRLSSPEEREVIVKKLNSGLRLIGMMVPRRFDYPMCKIAVRVRMLTARLSPSSTRRLSRW